MSVYNLVSLLGVFLLAGFAWLCSSNRRVVNGRALAGGIGLSLLFAATLACLMTGAIAGVFYTGGSILL